MTRITLKNAITVGLFCALIIAEDRRPLRRQVESKPRRDLRNAAVVALSAATLRILEKPVVERLSRAAETRGFGLIQWVKMPAWLQIPLSIVLMDYTLYIWHVLTHRVPLLWRLHMVHHADLDLSATTALRFHFLEMAVSVPWRAAQVALFGVRPRALAVWQAFLFACILFHHANLRLPEWLERYLVLLIVTPRMHGIHHSILERETNSNWSSGLTIWDWLHGTLHLDVPQNEKSLASPHISAGRISPCPRSWRCLFGADHRPAPYRYRRMQCLPLEVSSEQKKKIHRGHLEEMDPAGEGMM